MNTVDQQQGPAGQYDLSVQMAVRQMQQDLATTGLVQAQHLLRVLGDPGVGVSLQLPTAGSAQSRRFSSDALRLFCGL